MSYAQVLRGLTSGEERNANQAYQFNQQKLADERQRGQDRLKAISKFSSTLDEFIQQKAERDDKKTQQEMELLANEEHLEAKEQTGDPNISEEDNLQYIQNRDNVLETEKQLLDAASTSLDQGSSFQEAKEIHNFSGAELYHYVRAKSKIAADNYSDWLAGEMQNNKDLKLEANGIKFTPQTAETLEQKNIAMKALRREYMRQNDLGSVNPSLLNDENVGFYDKAISAHSSLFKQYEKDDAINSGFSDRIKAKDQFVIDKDFPALLGKIKISADEQGNSYNNKEALDEAFKIIEDAAINGEISDQDIENIRKQIIKVGDKEYPLSHWKTRWENFAQNISDAKKAMADARLEEYKIAKNNLLADWKDEEAKDTEQAISDDFKAAWVKRYTDETGEENPPEEFLNYLTAEDNEDVTTLDFHLDIESGGRGYLIEADLYGMSKAVKTKYKRFVKSDQDQLTENAFRKKADRSIKAYLMTITTLAAEDSNAEYDDALTNAEADYENEYLNAVQYTDSAKAHKIALDFVKERFAGEDGIITQEDKSGVYFTTESKISKQSIEKIKNQTDEIWKKFEVETEGLKGKEDLHDYFKNTVLPYSEDAIEEAEKYRELGSKKIPDYFKRIARRIPLITAWDLMDYQVKLNRKLKGQEVKGVGDEPLENAILKDETLEDVNKKLTYKSNPYSIYQASQDILDIKKYIDSTDEITVFKSIFNTDTNLMMPGIKLP
jgi:hypothetical protein